MNSFFLLFIGLPALEIFLMIKIGGKIGALSTVSLIFLTAIIGIYFAKLEGIKTMNSGVMNLYQNKVPVYEMFSGASIAIAEIIEKNTAHCNKNGIAIAVGEDAQVTQAYTLGVVKKASENNPSSPG